MNSKKKDSDDEDVEEGTLLDSGSSHPSTEELNARRNPPPHRVLPRSDVAMRALPGIVLHIFRILPDGTVDPHEDAYAGLAEALKMTRQSKKFPKEKVEVEMPYWVHIDADERDRVELNEWIDQLDLGDLVSEQIKKPRKDWLSHVVCTRSRALIMIRILPLIDEDGDFIADGVEYLAAVKSQHILITYTTTQSGGRNNLSKDSIQYMTRDESLQDGSSSAALISWLEFHVMRTLKAMVDIRKKTLLLVKQMDIDPYSIQLEDILSVRDNLLVVLAVSEEQSQCLNTIKKMDIGTESVDFTNLHGALSILVSTADSTERMGTRMEKRAKQLKQGFDALQQDRMNRRLAILTVVSAIFMPLTFMAGIYGMNFVNIPELENENGYFILLGSMLLIALSMLAFFYKNNWFE